MEYNIYEVNQGCTTDKNTCRTPIDLVMQDCFIEQVHDPLDVDALSVRLMLGALFDACVNGNCPGLRLSVWEEILRHKSGDL